MIFINLFRLDWFLIDSIIIIFLLIILFCVKIFKEKSRWRHFISNKALSSKKIKKSNLNELGDFNLIKYIKIIKNVELRELERPKIVIIILITKNLKKIYKLLINGLSNYGFDIVKIKLNNNINDFYELKVNKYDEFFTKLIMQIKTILEKTDKKIKSCMLILDSKTELLKFSKLNLIKNKALLIINPKINESFIKNISNIVSNANLTQKLLIIFSKKSYIFLNNINLKKFLKLYPNYKEKDFNLRVIEKSRKSFKYYETFLLGIIIDLLEPFI